MSGNVPDSARYELKFVASPLLHRRVEHWIRLHPDGFFSPYPERRVNNVYFDNFDFFAYEENLVGTSARTKVRLRWYGATWTPDGCTLELKRRRNMLGWKISHRTGPMDFVAMSWLEIRGKLRSELPGSAQTWLDANPRPVLINRYQRQYFESRDRKVRMTLDRNQEVYAQTFGRRPNRTRKTNLPVTLIVECKFSTEDRRRGMAAIQGIPLRVGRNSKYVVGVQSLQR
ncbi:MAG: VTC domain-containing protein [Deltaproteobacteria bacterium]|nr:VTC domain-containing protein [Deltaproteobacteria bacterium]MBW2359857.1 VTC domain-containing protein [Deltaproteobacteria bacterium]